jgi:hypothetical protein
LFDAREVATKTDRFLIKSVPSQEGRAPITRLFAALAVVLTAATLAASATADSGVVGHWPLTDGAGTNVVDVSGFANNGVLSGDAAWAPGRSASALRFGGRDGQVKVTDAPSLEPTGAVTVSAWVEHAGSPGAYRYIVAKGATGCVAASYGLYTGPNGGLQFYVSQGSGTTYTRSADAGSGVWNGQWHLVVGTFDGSALRVFVDGTEVGSAVAAHGSLVYRLPSSNDLYIGNYPGCGQLSFVGLIDDVTVWDRALTATEVRGLEPTGPPAAPGGVGGVGGVGTGGATGGSSPGSSGGSPSPGPTGDLPGPTGDLPLLTHLWWTQTSLLAGANGRLASHGHGLMVTYRDDQGARVTFTLVRLEAGVRLKRRCVAPGRRRPPHAPACTRQVVIGSFMHTDHPGRTTLHFTGLRGHPLTTGHYRLILTPRSRGRLGAAVVISFSVRRLSPPR